MDDLKQDSNINIHTDEEVTSKSVELLIGVALPESVIEATFQTRKVPVDYLPTLEDIISKYKNEKHRMLMILTYDASFLQGSENDEKIDRKRLLLQYRHGGGALHHFIHVKHLIELTYYQSDDKYRAQQHVILIVRLRCETPD